MKKPNVFISPTLGVPPILVKSLREKGFTFMLLQQGDRNPIKSKIGLGLDFLKDSWAVARQIKTLRETNVVVVNSYVALTVLLLHSLGFIRYRKLIYFGFFLHAPRYYPLFRWLFRWLLTEEDTLLVFSKHEVGFYETTLRLKPGNVSYAPLPYQLADNVPSIEQLPIQIPATYYFAGGYTNRDYGALIEVFRYRPELLVICGSSLNTDLAANDLPRNIIVLKDLPREPFKALVAHSMACILPIKDDTGAAGQSFVLEAMAYQKVVIATQTRVLAELIDPGKTGFLLTDLTVQLPGLLTRLNQGGYDLTVMGKGAYEKLLTSYSEDAFADALRTMIDGEVSVLTPENR